MVVVVVILEKEKELLSWGQVKKQGPLTSLTDPYKKAVSSLILLSLIY